MAAATAADIGHAAAEAAKAASENINSETRIARRSVENKDRENIYYMHIYIAYIIWYWYGNGMPISVVSRIIRMFSTCTNHSQFTWRTDWEQRPRCPSIFANLPFAKIYRSLSLSLARDSHTAFEWVSECVAALSRRCGAFINQLQDDRLTGNNGTIRASSCPPSQPEPGTVSKECERI